MSGVPTTLYGYDPARVVTLRHRTIEAVDELGSLRCDDPLAADATRVVRLLRLNLEDSWLPLIDAICSSRALIAWRATLHAADRAIHHADRTAGAVGDGLPTWIATTSLGHLADHDLAQRLGRATADLVDRVERGGDLAGAVGELAEVAREARQRAGHDPDGSLGALLAGVLGPEGTAALTGAFGSLHGLVRAAHLVDVAAAETIVTDLAVVVAALSRSSPPARDALGNAVARSPELGRAVVDHLGRFDGATVMVVARHLVAAFGSVAASNVDWQGTVRAGDDRPVLEPLLARLATDPRHALALLGDHDVLRTLVLDDLLDSAVAEDVIAAGLAAPGVDVAHTVGALEVLADLVHIATRHELSPGARRGIARSFGVHLPHLAPHLDQRFPVDVTVRGTPQTGADTIVVALGSYAAVAQLLGQVADDEPAQLLLGLVVGAFREEQLDRAATLLRDPNRPHDPTGARDLLAASLADVTRAATLIGRGIDERNRMLAFLHGINRSALTTVTGLVANLVSWFAPGAPLSGRIATVSSRVVTSALAGSTPPRVPDTGFETALATHFVVSALALPVGDATVRAALGLDEVPEPLWREVVEIVDAIEATGDPEEQRLLRSRLRSAANAEPALDVYLELLAATSGDASLG